MTLRLFLPLALAAFAAQPLFANDTEAEWAIGGLELVENDTISMDREELYISSELVKVDYTYTNHSDEPQTLLVSFPLPAMPSTDTDWLEYYQFPDWAYLEFSTTVDGMPVDWQMADRAMIDGNDVTALVEAEGFPLHWYQDYEFIESVSELDKDETARLLALGLIEPDPNGWRSFMPAWQVQRHITREQVFAAHATVQVSHSYAPYVGGTVGGVIHQLADGEFPDLKADYERDYCTDAAFLAGVRNRVESMAAENEYGVAYGETWIGYVLSSGANWRGPIGEFRLVVDKGEPENLVSFCMDGVSRISPTQFEVRRTNFEPDADLDILLVTFWDPNAE
jgi:hypothetical protein